MDRWLDDGKNEVCRVISLSNAGETWLDHWCRYSVLPITLSVVLQVFFQLQPLQHFPCKFADESEMESFLLPPFSPSPHLRRRFPSLTFPHKPTLNSLKEIEGHIREKPLECVYYRQRWPGPTIIFNDHLLSEAIWTCVSPASLPLPSFLPFPFCSIHEPVGIVGLAAVVAHVPDCFLGQTSRRRAWRGRKGKNIECSRRGGEDTVAALSLFNYSNGRCPSALVLSARFEY